MRVRKGRVLQSWLLIVSRVVYHDSVCWVLAPLDVRDDNDTRAGVRIRYREEPRVP